MLTSISGKIFLLSLKKYISAFGGSQHAMHGQQDAFTDELQRRIRERFQVRLLLHFHVNTEGKCVVNLARKQW
jgi:hypothetical protein